MTKRLNLGNKCIYTMANNSLFKALITYHAIVTI